MFGKKASPPPIQAVIAEDSRIVGEVTCDTAICVEGKVIGDLKGVSVTIDRTGSVEGLIEAGTLEIYGIFRGEGIAAKVILRASADVEGPLSFQTIVIEEGAKITSSLTQRKPEDEVEEPSSTSALLMAASSRS